VSNKHDSAGAMASAWFCTPGAGAAVNKVFGKLKTKSLEQDMDFNAGVIAALGVVTAHDQETLWTEIVLSCNQEQLMVYALVNEDWEWAGFKAYAKRNLNLMSISRAKVKARQIKKAAKS
jgi:hypothetical protein